MCFSTRVSSCRYAEEADDGVERFDEFVRSELPAAADKSIRNGLGQLYLFAAAVLALVFVLGAVQSHVAATCGDACVDTLCGRMHAKGGPCDPAVTAARVVPSSAAAAAAFASSSSSSSSFATAAAAASSSSLAPAVLIYYPGLGHQR
jgi:hypothetical protein